MSHIRNSKDTLCIAVEKDWFHLLLEIERCFRAEERKYLRAECEITPKVIENSSADNST
jgi:hypothetical protein